LEDEVIKISEFLDSAALVERCFENPAADASRNLRYIRERMERPCENSIWDAEPASTAMLASIVCPPEILAQRWRAVLAFVRAQAEAIPKSIEHEQAECAAEQARKDVKKGRPHRHGSR
jgi:hypothetical protein